MKVATALLFEIIFGVLLAACGKSMPDPIPIDIIETTAQTTTVTTTTTEATTTTIATTTETTTTTYVTTELTDTMTYLGEFTATYYKGSSVPCYGGSGRMLVSCYEKDEWYKGSVASKFIYEKYGYYVNDKTMVYIEFGYYPRLNGYYSVDDCNADSRIVDFYFADFITCPWQRDGVTTVEMWMEETE